MNWLKLIASIIGLAYSVTKYLEKRRAISQAEAVIIKDNLYDTLQKIDKALAARRSVDHSPDRVRDDPRNRDN